MQILKRISVAPFAIMLAAASAMAHAENVDCRTCHMHSTIPGIGDFERCYNLPPDGHSSCRMYSMNHPAGIRYPAGPSAYRSYKMPNGLSGNIAFFDRNGNGQPDIDEVQLFATGAGAPLLRSDPSAVRGGALALSP